MFYPNISNKSRESVDNLMDVSLPNYEKPIHSNKEMQPMYAFAANTNQGINRNYNEDRVSIVLNADCPQNQDKSLWPKVHFFGVYDGHGGHG